MVLLAQKTTYFLLQPMSAPSVLPTRKRRKGNGKKTEKSNENQICNSLVFNKLQMVSAKVSSGASGAIIWAARSYHMEPPEDTSSGAI